MLNVQPMQLRLLRLVAGLTLDTLGRKVGVSGAHLWRAERGYIRLKPDKERLWIAALAHVRLPATPLGEDNGEGGPPSGRAA